MDLRLRNDLRVVQICKLMTDKLGIVQPASYMQEVRPDKNTIAVLVKWPIGIDKRAADNVMKAANIPKLDQAGQDPHTSVYVISVRTGRSMQP